MQLDRFLPYRLSVLSLKISNEIAQNYAQFDITIAQWRVMVILNQYQQLNAKQLVQYSQMDKVRVSRTMQSTLKRGLTLMHIDTSDARARIYRLTDKGQTLVNTVIPSAIEFEKKLYTALDSEEIQSLDRIINKLEAAI